MNGVKEIVNENERFAETIDITAFQRFSSRNHNTYRAVMNELAQVYALGQAVAPVPLQEGICR
jgi:hypothetical protein